MQRLFLALCFSLGAAAKKDLSGTWVSECHPYNKKSFKSKVVFKNATELVEFKLFEDEKCTEHSLTVIYEAVFITGAKFGAGKKFNSVPTKIQMSLHLPSLVESFNKPDSADGCGINNWKLNVPQDVSGKFCRLFKMPSVGKPVYDIYKLNLNSIVFGGLPTQWDMSDPTVRPSKLSKTEFWIEKKK